MVLLETFGELKKFFQPSKVIIDNIIHKMHYRWTTMLFIACCTLVSLNQFFGTPIECITNKETKPYSEKFINTYCWIQSTFSIITSWNKTIGIEIPYPGIDNNLDDKQIVYHAYYQWVGILLFIQGLTFYLPHSLWKRKESGRIGKLKMDLDKILFDKEYERNKQLKILANYFIDNRNQSNHCYLNWFILVEILQFANIIIQIRLINKFLGGYFHQYGPDVYHFLMNYNDGMINPMIRVFPRVTKCTFRMFGASGTLEKHDTLCILSINILNEKIYICIWFWLYLLTIITGLSLIYRMAIYFLNQLRTKRIEKQISDFNDCINHYDIDFIIQHLNKDQWFTLNLLLKNIDPINGYELLSMMKEILHEKQMIIGNGGKILIPKSQSIINSMDSNQMTMINPNSNRSSSSITELSTISAKSFNQMNDKTDDKMKIT
ncbi:innexin inx2-like [Dermatophagoides pteronyssinus]|uniref:innexin inx2-like n=1 Tax=Dermatophagoides pteronyssinus TaxID=6956 RepID=UPI003F66EB3E